MFKDFDLKKILRKEGEKKISPYKSDKTEDESSDDDESDFRKKDEEARESAEEQKRKLENCDETQSLIEELKNKQGILPESHQQRNLDRENGGLEANKKEGTYTSEDVWDDRSEEVDKMGSANPAFNFKSFILEKKRKEKMMAKKVAKEALLSGLDVDKKQLNKIILKSGGQPKMGIVERIKTLKQDHGHDNDGGGILR